MFVCQMYTNVFLEKLLEKDHSLTYLDTWQYIQEFLDFRGSLGEKEVRESPNPRKFRTVGEPVPHFKALLESYSMVAFLSLSTAV